MFKRLSLVSSIVLTLSGTAAAADDSDWGYEGSAGPENWGGLCESGRMQSPIDLATANAIGEVSVSVDWTSGPLTLQNSGKTVQASFSEGSHMTSSGKVFKLLQVHFHTPSEHVINGEYYPLVAHFVHANDEGELAVLGVLFEEGEEHFELQKLIEGASLVGAEPSQVGNVTFNPEALLPQDLEVYRYMGSLTTPPCSEGVSWHVAKDVVEAHPDQIAALEELMGHNSRPVQHLHSRLLVAPE